MKIKNNPALRLFRPSDTFIPLALLGASLMGRSAAALGLFLAWYAAKLCPLATSDGLRAAFATQPSMKYVQGSGLVAMACQLPGAALAALILHLVPCTRPLMPLIPCGLLLNIEHVFYEYLCAVGDSKSAIFSRCITSVLTLLGLALCAPPAQGAFKITAVESTWPLITCGLSAMIGLFVSFSLGGSLRPVPNLEVLRHAPLSMLQAALCPALTLTALALLWPTSFSPAPLFAGLTLYEACRTPFRRSSMEAGPMNRLLAIVSAAALLLLVTFQFLVIIPQSAFIAMTCTALLIASMCALVMFGRIS